MEPQFLLASGSPRRADLLRSAGLRFARVVADVPEVPPPGQSPLDYAVATAKAKSLAGQRAARSELPVLGADTDVSIDGLILGKPRDRTDAIEMLLSLSSRSHEVCSAVALTVGDVVDVITTMTRVQFGVLTPEQASEYWDTGEPVDKAGAYAIQGLAARWIRSIDGSYTGVVGLPLYETLALLARHGIYPDAFASVGRAGAIA